MIEVHHLKESRSRRITWLLEELGQPYTVIAYDRDPATRLAPPELKAITPLGKAPVIRDNGRVLFESGAIIDYLVRRYGAGRLAPAVDSEDYDRYVQFLQYAEGSAMLPVMLKLYVGRLKEAGAPLQPRIESEIDNHIGFINDELGKRDYIAGDEFSAADVQLSFVVQLALQFYGKDKWPNVTAYVERLESRPAYRKALAEHGA
jgi:glutathione S-transferase